MKAKVTSLGVLFEYPYEEEGPFRMMRQYVIEASDGRIDTYEEWDEEEIISGDYDFPEDILDKIFDKPIEVGEDEW